MTYAFPTETLSAKCNLCGKVYTLDVDAAALATYRAGAFVQVAFPECSPADREIIMAGVRGTFFVGECCWSSLEGDDD